jgi:hypothetical protein
MADFTVTVQNVQHVPAMGSDLRLRQITRVSILVGSYGPFTKDFPPGQDSPDQINAWKLIKQQEIQAIAPA